MWLSHGENVSINTLIGSYEVPVITEKIKTVLSNGQKNIGND